MLSTKIRIDTIEGRTKSTTLPKIDEVFKRSGELNMDLSRTFVDQVNFSEYPNIHEDGAAIIETFLINSRNIDKLKSSGSLGAVIEGFRRIDIEKESKSEMMESLIHSLNVLTEEDISSQQKLLNNIHSIPILKNLCVHCCGSLQSTSFSILDRLSQLPNGIDLLLKHDIFSVLMTPEMLFRNSTLQCVRHGTCQLVHKITTRSPSSFPITKFMELLLDKHGNRRIDGYMEMQLLHGFLAYLIDLESKSKRLDTIFVTIKHLINEIISEAFENLEHLQQIIKCCVMLSRDPSQALYMLDNSLNMALQFLVKTDFSLYRRKSAPVGSPSKLKNKIAKIQSSTKRLSIQDTGERAQGTLLALAMIRPDMKVNRNDDVNFIATRAAISIFENIINYRIETISEIVSSGLVPSLLFRVGKGHDKDARFNKIVVHFIYEILHKVIISQTHGGGNHMSLLSDTRSGEYTRFRTLEMKETHNEVSSKHEKSKAHVIDIRGISNTMHAQGVTQLLYSNFHGVEDILVMQESLVCLSYLTFNIIATVSMETENIGKVVHLCGTRHECFFPALSIICDMILFPDISEESCEYLVRILKVVKILIKALKLSGWVFPLKSLVFLCLGKLAHIAGFRDFVWTSDGVSVVSYEVQLRRCHSKATAYGYRALRNPDEDEASERLYSVLKRDIHASKIQAMFRAVRGRLRARRVKSSRR